MSRGGSRGPPAVFDQLWDLDMRSNYPHLRTVLVCDGTSDAALEHPFRWLLNRHGFAGNLDFQVVPPSQNTSHKLARRLPEVLKQWRPDVLLIHRDAESEGFAARYYEIQSAVPLLPAVQWIPVIPVRMLESWLLFDPQAIRIAAGNPTGKSSLSLPSKISQLEAIPDPKQRLFEALKIASEKKGRRLQKFVPQRYRHLVAEEIGDFSQLLVLPAFKEFSDHVEKLVKRVEIR
jgi:hypothetical protein